VTPLLKFYSKLKSVQEGKKENYNQSVSHSSMKGLRAVASKNLVFGVAVTDLEYASLADSNILLQKFSEGRGAELFLRNL
jgi:hypothetical protein